ncbi:MAG: Nramp family divalent metal transporter [Gammaproteobacteria bacterium]|jgi:manganese transport protein|nr:Nramp family divalent metal transporter [Gammaproteobacteria bacterium]MBT5202447.1 Nramp family divalent metal transporter [Gammaproteobacteria bacterium]MBT5601426.1 Nramp family divalent metal transporter [Gammaproteobacteria bacterium]MBT6246991.1 Nramp family divalent metal transporter [Gammaproteobacteria bacterium]
MAIDLYTQPADAVETAPEHWLQRLKFLGPGIIISASIVGSGEIILTASLGAAVGFSMLWWVVLSCWSKSIVQASLARYIVLSGDTYLRALNRIPGKLPGPKGEVSWPVIIGLIAFLPAFTGLGGLIGGAGQALLLLFPGIPDLPVVACLAVIIAMLLRSGRYQHLERIMLLLVFIFTLLTVTCLILMQSTGYAVQWQDITQGFQFEFSYPYAVLALAAYGYTGVNSGEISSYTYWCIEKGYPGKIGINDGSEQWVSRAKGWLRIMHMDVWITLALLTCATIPFYFLGAGILHALGEVPSGQQTIVILSQMFTETMGPWSLWIFAVGAFCILFSSCVAGVAAGGRYIPDYLIELGFLARNRLDIRRSIIRYYGLTVPFIGLLLYAGFQRPVLMVSIAACFGALMLPIQCGITIYLQKERLPKILLPSKFTQAFLYLTFAFQVVMAGLVLYFVVF